MNAFVACRGCGAQIHETALSCPKCGAPQTAPVAVAAGPIAADALPSAYHQVRWFRRRWFLIVCLLTIAPIAALIALTGEMYYASKGVVKTLPKNFKTSVLVLSAYYVYALFFPVGSHQQMICFLLALALSVLIGTKR